MVETLEMGRWFHDWLATEKEKLHLPSVNHPADDEHDVAVGTALLACLRGDVDEGIAAYNAWAAGAGYAKVSVIGMDPVAIDIHDGVVVVWDGSRFMLKPALDPRLVSYLASIGVGPEAIDGWKVEVAKRAGEDVAFVLINGCEIHLLMLVEKRAMTRKNILQFVAPLIEEFGFCTTKVPIAETDHRLRHQLGFTETWCDESWRYFACTELPYQKRI